ncbi:MAG TPA: serine/threonine-protein kinase [Pyrinomonadaceae bacterium]|nr:serine/threonine-protein kinase [Pyrinomonadaceae bacterium]
MNNPNETQETKHFAETEEMAERWQKIKILFEKASAISGKEREKFLKNSCGNDVEMRREVEKLLVSFESSESFLENPAVAEAVSLFEDKKTLVGKNTTGNINNGNFVAGTVLASRYRIIGLLGKGGMGEVYKAEDLKLSQTVALKFLPDRLEKDQFALERFHAEVRTARQVSHPNVCRVFDIGELEGRHFLSMEFIDGDDLSSLLRRIGRLPSERAIEIARQLCVGLSAIHNAGILHRDFKPANVIIDSKGKARITDFGIAGLAEDVAKDSLRIGTPAYMSPEQIAGKDVSTRSDIYALGLVLYEIFTGKQAFCADTIPELIKKHQTETPTNPSKYVKGIDPLVESVIAQCLEKNPKERPQSALHVAMALPGGNPLQVALEAGETPSPEMVAASPKKGALKPVIALSCVIGAILMIGICLFISMKIAPQNRIPFNKSGEILSERANEIAQKLGFTDTPLEKWSRFYYDNTYEKFALQNSTPENWEKISSGQPLMFVFVERQSPRYFDIWMAGNGYWLFEPQTTSEMRSISLDTRGRLVGFSAVPPQFSENSKLNTNTDFSIAFQSAELDFSKFKEVQPNWTPPNAFDERKAWEGVMADHAEIPLRVEAASFQGKIVSFQLIYPWTKPIVAETEKISTRDWINTFVFAGILIGLIIIAIFLVRKHLKSGSGDRKGAFKISLVVFALVAGGWLFSMSHVPAFFPELNRFVHSIRIGLYAAAVTWLLYLALEPIIRRNLPELMVSWNRLLIGDWRDPLVGRDVLFGTLFGIAQYFLAVGGRFAEQIFNDDHKTFFISDSLIGLRSSVATFLIGSSTGIFGGFAYLCVLGFLFLLLRRQNYASIALFLLIATVSVLFFTTSLVNLPFTLIISALITLIISRIGLVATIFSVSVFGLLQTSLLTLNFSAWYANGMIFVLLIIFALLIYGFKISLANQTLFSSAKSFES